MADETSDFDSRRKKRQSYLQEQIAEVLGGADKILKKAGETDDLEEIEDLPKRKKPR